MILSLACRVEFGDLQIEVCLDIFGAAGRTSFALELTITDSVFLSSHRVVVLPNDLPNTRVGFLMY